MISRPRHHTSCSSKVISASAAVANLLHRTRMPWIQEHPCDSWLWDVPKIQTLAAQPRLAWALADVCTFASPCRKRTLFLVGKVDNRDLHHFARKCAGTSGPHLSFALAMVLTKNSRRFQRTRLFLGTAGCLISASGCFGVGVVGLLLTCGCALLALVSHSTQVVTRSNLPMGHHVAHSS